MRGLLHGGSGLRLGVARRDRPPGGVSGRDGRAVCREVRAAGRRSLQPDREAGRRLHLLGQATPAARSIPPVPSSARPGPSGRKTWRRQRIGITFGRSAPARAKAASTPWMRSYHPSRRPQNERRRCPPADERDHCLDPGWPRPSFAPCTTKLDAEVARLGPVCQLSGRCCRFKEYGHTLFVSTAEVQFLLGSGARASSGRSIGARLAPGRMPAGTARHAKAGHWAAAFITATHLRSDARTICRNASSPGSKQLTDNHGLPWNYAPLASPPRSRGVSTMSIPS